MPVSPLKTASATAGLVTGSDEDNFPKNNPVKKLSIVEGNNGNMAKDFKTAFGAYVTDAFDDGIAHKVDGKYVDAKDLLLNGYKTTDATKALFDGVEGEFDFAPMPQVSEPDLADLIEHLEEEIQEMRDFTAEQYDDMDIDDDTLKRRSDLLSTYQSIVDTELKPLDDAFKRHADVVGAIDLTK